MDMEPPAPPRAHHPGALLAVRRRAVEAIALRPSLHASGGAGPRAAPVLAVATSRHTGNTWDGELALVDAAAPGGWGAAAGHGGGVSGAAVPPQPLAELPCRDTLTSVAWAGGPHGAALLAAGSDSGDVAVYAVAPAPFRLGSTPAKAVAALEYHDAAVAAVAALRGGGGGGGSESARLASASWDGT
jgi:hypothetical protein